VAFDHHQKKCVRRLTVALWVLMAPHVVPDASPIRSTIMAIVCPRRASSCVVAAALAVYVVLGCSAGVDAVAIRATWPQPFQNTRNTGESVVSGPVGPGSCPNDLLPDSVNKAQYFHTGVLSLDNQRLYVGR